MSTTMQSHSVNTNSNHGLQPTYEELCHNTQLLILLRWVAGFSIFFAGVISRWILAIDIKIVPLLALSAIVLVYNAILAVLCRSHIKTLTGVQRIAWGQILLDWLAMLGLVHFTGGINSPALIYFVVHAALSGTILLPWQTRSLSVLAIGLVGAVAWLEGAGVIPHITIKQLELGDTLHENHTYVAAVLFFFGTTVIILSELVARNAQRIRQREQHIRQLYDARETFVRVATHELRAPLGASLSLMRNIEQGYAGELSEQQAAILSRVTHRLEGLRTLIDDLLTLARSREASTAHAPLEPDSVRDVLLKLLERERPHAEHKQIALESHIAQEPGIVLAGEVGLQIILGNLINNAIKYTPDGGHVTIDYHINAARHAAEVIVSDTGIGIPKDDLPNIFNEFFRAQNAKNAQIGGTGIGLATVKTLVERYKGKITLDSREGEGTTVQVTLPLAPKSHAHGPAGELKRPAAD